MSERFYTEEYLRRSSPAMVQVEIPDDLHVQLGAEPLAVIFVTKEKQFLTCFVTGALMEDAVRCSASFRKANFMRGRTG